MPDGPTLQFAHRRARLLVALVSAFVAAWWFPAASARTGTASLPDSEEVVVEGQAQAPGAFGRLSPGNGATGLSWGGVTLSWTSSSDAVRYEYCANTYVNCMNPGSGTVPWISTGLNTSVMVVGGGRGIGLAYGVPYYWHVRAINTNGTTYADGSETTFWTFTPGSTVGAFGKTAPTAGATNLPTSLTLTWGASSEATNYDLCLDLTHNATCEGGWTSIGNVTSWPVANLSPGFLYSWQVRAGNAGGTTDANGGTWWSFIPGPTASPSGDFTSDGSPELVFQNASGQVHAWILSGLTFDSGEWLTQNIVGADWRVVGTSDLSGDNKADLLWQNQTDGSVSLHAYDGFTPTGTQAIPVGANTPWRIMATADFNGDTRADIVWQNFTSGQVYVWSMNASGGLASFAIGSYVTTADLSPVTLNPTARTEWRIAGAGDFNGDGKRDLVWRNIATGAVTVWTLDGTVLTGSLNYGIVDLAWQLHGVGNYYGDGTPDLVWRHTGTGQVYLWVRDNGALLPNTSLGTTSVAWQVVGAK